MDRIKERTVRAMLKDIVMPLDFGFIHTRGKYASSDTMKALLLKDQVAAEQGSSAIGKVDIKGLFILPVEYPVPVDIFARQENISMVEAWRSYVHEFTWIMQVRDDRGDRSGDPNALENLPSFDYFTDRLDLLLEIFDLNVSLQFSNSQGFHTLLRTVTPLYDHPVSDLGSFHFAKLQLETRVKVPILCR
jgi:hypothetical protein